MPLALAADTFDEEERRAVAAVLASGQYTMGPRVRELEAAFAAKLGKRHAVMVNSGSSANLVAVAALCHREHQPLRPGDEVIVPCIGWATTYTPLQQYGLRLKFVDVDLETLNFDVDQLRDAVTARTRMIVTVSVLGNPCDFGPILELCHEHGILLFEDNCESLGARYDGRQAGTFGLVGTFSTFFSHHISTIEGGFVATDDFELYCLMASIRNHGWTRGQPEGSPLLAGREESEFAEAYRFVLPGYNVRPTEIAGALGLCQLAKLDAFLAARRKNARTFVGLFGGDPRFVIQREVGESSWFSFTFVVRPDSGLSRERVLAKLDAAGFENRMVTGGSYLRHPAVRYCDHQVHSRDNADLVHDRGFFVGNHVHDLTAELHRLRDVLADV
ncbi:MAG TPA: DegT/DnrJ/EryC1/StrS family aminotransferase [Thermoanaerobaculia bacterium]|jgi:CDP-6-deoxy-D-xylo-4-hexulose-3-dehydrase|nr:DegT/DnrJ/EryC1/StrS family aminotransferase [Thermoanaerobaculia bacterium]